jgi:hypothetical protein
LSSLSSSSSYTFDGGEKTTTTLTPKEWCVPTDMELYASLLFDLGEYGRAAMSFTYHPHPQPQQRHCICRCCRHLWMGR